MKSRVVPPADIESHMALLMWFSEQANTGVKAKFAPYLDFEGWH
jgi:hypothetical protein